MVWGYVFGKATAKFQKNQPNLALLILAGALSDFDLFTRQPYGTLFGHHGISHSWLVMLLVAAPFFYAFGKRTLPYLVAALQHPLFGDLIANHVPLLFPVTLTEIGLNLSEVSPAVEIGLELLGFTLFLIVLISSGDWKARIHRTAWTTSCLLLWIPPTLLTVVQGFWYYETDLLTQIYSAYAVISSLFLVALAGIWFLRSVK
jgi:hypothetical protein